VRKLAVGIALTLFAGIVDLQAQSYPSRQITHGGPVPAGRFN
jgi:hypothetical protein